MRTECNQNSPILRDYLIVNHHYSLDIYDELTAMAWINPKKLSEEWWRNIVYKGETHLPPPDSPCNYQFAAHTDRIAFDYHDGTDWDDTRSSSVLEIDTWQHIAVTVTTLGNVTLYRNGFEVGTGLRASPFVTNTEDLGIGAMAGGWRGFNGTIDEVRIYNRALSSSEIAALYNSY